MKRIFCILALVLLVMLAGCSGHTEGKAWTDSHECYPFDQSATSSSYLATDSAAYYITASEDHKVYLIYARPVDSEQFVLLCGRPNCSHTDKNCNAYAGVGLGFYRNRIYTTVPSMENGFCMEVVSMRPDGTDRKSEAKIPFVFFSDGHVKGMDHCVFHNGKLLLYFSPDDSAPYEEQVARIFCLDLETKELIEPFASYSTPNIRPWISMRPSGHYVYDACEYRNADGSIENWLVEMDLDSGSVRKLLQPADALIYDTFYVDGDTLYYLEPAQGFVEYHLRTGKTVVKEPPVEGLAYAYYDENQIYAHTVSGENWEYRTIYFLSRDYQLVDQLTLPERMVYRWRDGQYLYFTLKGDFVFSHVLNRQDIGSGRLSLAKIGEQSAPQETETGAVSDPVPVIEQGSIEGLPEVQTALSGQVIHAEQGTFFVNWENPAVLRSIPKGETTPQPVCAKPGCDHTTEDCNAVVPCFDGLGYFRDRLYLACFEDPDLVVYSADPATGARQREFALTQPGCTPNNVLFHGNALLVVFRPSDTDSSSDESSDGQYLQLVDLPSGQVRSVCREFLDEDTMTRFQNGIGGHYHACGKNIFCFGYRPTKNGGVSQLGWIDIETGVFTELLPMGRVPDYCVTEDTIRFFDPDEGFVEYSRKTGEITTRPNVHRNASVAFYEDDLIVLRCDLPLPDSREELSDEEWAAIVNKIDYYFLSPDHTVLDSLHGTSLRYLFATQEALYFTDLFGQVLYLPRDQIGSGDLTVSALQ